MAMGPVSLEQYLNTSYDPDVEYVDGVLVGRNVGTPSHSRLQTNVAALFVSLEQTYGFRAFVECRLRISAATGRHRIPRRDGARTPYTRGRVITDVPAIVVEIKSPDDTFDAIFEKCLEYASLGVPNIVVLDPDHKRQYRFSNNALELVSSLTLHLPKAGADLHFPGDELFADLDDEDSQES
jgi:Uma2 family endonuclease